MRRGENFDTPIATLLEGILSTIRVFPLDFEASTIFSRLARMMRFCLVEWSDEHAERRAPGGLLCTAGWVDETRIFVNLTLWVVECQ